MYRLQTTDLIETCWKQVGKGLRGLDCDKRGHWFKAWEVQSRGGISCLLKAGRVVVTHVHLQNELLGLLALKCKSNGNGKLERLDTLKKN